MDFEEVYDVNADGEHELSDAYSFWFLNKKSVTNWEEDLKCLGEFKTVEGFWGFYNFMKRPSDLPPQVDLYLFRASIRPMWEDAANREGGRWVLRCKKGMASRCWENLCLALIGDDYNVGKEICGIVCSTKFHDDILSVWTKHSDVESRNRVREVVKKVLAISTNMAMEFRPHEQSVRHAAKLHRPVSDERNPRDAKPERSSDKTE